MKKAKELYQQNGFKYNIWRLSLYCFNKTCKYSNSPSHENYENSLANGVEYYFKTNNIKRKIHIVNRLDKNTSGLVVIAKNEYIQENLAIQMKKEYFVKKYIAIVERNSRRKRRNNR